MIEWRGGDSSCTGNTMKNRRYRGVCEADLLVSNKYEAFSSSKVRGLAWSAGASTVVVSDDLLWLEGTNNGV